MSEQATKQRTFGYGAKTSKPLGSAKPKNKQKTLVKQEVAAVPATGSETKQSSRPIKVSGGRRKRNRINQLGRPVEQGVPSAFSCGTGATKSDRLGGEQPYTSDLSDRPSALWRAPCPDIGQAHYFGCGVYCTKCGEYQDSGSDDAESTHYDGTALVFESRIRDTKGLVTTGETQPLTRGLCLLGAGELAPRRDLHRPYSPLDVQCHPRLRYASRAGSLVHTPEEQLHSEDANFSCVPIANSTRQSTSFENIYPCADPASKRSSKRRRVQRYMERAASTLLDKGLSNSSYIRHMVSKGVGKYRRRHCERFQPCGYNFSNKTADALQGLFQEPEETLGNLSADRLNDSGCSSFSEPSRWYTSTLERLGYQRDSFTFGEIGTKIRNLVKEDSRGTACEVVAKKDINQELYTYLFKEKMPVSEYCKTGLYDRNLAIIHMQKLTKQYNAKNKIDTADLASEGVNVHTQSMVVDELAKEFLWSKNKISEDKYSGFLEACHTISRHKKAGLAMITIAATSYVLVKSTPSVVTVVDSSLSHLGRMSSWTLASIGTIANQTNFSPFLNRLCQAGPSPM